jgi:hypothetical protein
VAFRFPHCPTKLQIQLDGLIVDLNNWHCRLSGPSPVLNSLTVEIEKSKVNKNLLNFIEIICLKIRNEQV